MNGLQRWRYRWEVAGAAVLPLAKGSKRPVCKAWQVEPPQTQWSSVGPSFRGNIGVPCGNGLAVIDADSPGTVVNVTQGVTGLGLALPEVETVSGGRHFYLRVKDVPKNFNWARLAVSVGPGELRARNAYVAAPCSQVAGRRYRFLHGDPEATAKLKQVRWRDLQFLLAPATTSAVNLNEPPVRLLWRSMPTRASVLLAELAKARKGHPVDGYPTRSEAEAAVVAMLILAGWTLEQIQETFAGQRPGHYAEKSQQQRERYLALTYQKVLAYLASAPERMQIADLYQQARSWPWPGRGGNLERDVLLAVLAIGWQVSSFEVAASLRCLAEYTAATCSSVSGALERLEQGGHLARVSAHTQTRATVWHIQARTPSQIQNISHTSVYTGSAGSSAGDDLNLAAVEVWSVLGRSCGAVFEHLAGGQVWTVRDLAERTGKHPNTVRAALRKLAGYDLACAVKFNACAQPVGWALGKLALAQVAEDLNAEAAAKRRRALHEREREEWKIAYATKYGAVGLRLGGKTKPAGP